ncbi:O-antigen ligase family protein [Gaetbulibacter jejuensis]|uniref:O-antigen ligase family protein n=1 Tax=Gaetbulibacter jejuensis TaxID=584607 RepID=UPI003007F654
MKILKYIILILILWGIDSFSFFVFGETIGGYVSHLTFILLLGYYFFARKRPVIIPLAILGISYFIISGLTYIDNYEVYINEFIKYGILIICGAEVARDTSSKELILFLLIGATSVLIHSLFFADNYGRYSGFYLNPNGAAFVCLIGYCLTFNISNKTTKYLFTFIFTFAGILTFSRFFFLMWFLITLLSVISNKKNLQLFGIGISTLALLISFATILQVNTTRFSLLIGLLNNNAQTERLTEDSRMSRWSTYYNDILDKPIFGNGYKSFSGIDNIKQGVHNTYLMVLGEAGIIPFLIIIGIYLYLIRKTIYDYKTNTDKLLLAISLSAILLTMHNYFNYYLILFITIWLFNKVSTNNSQENEITL